MKISILAIVFSFVVVGGFAQKTSDVLRVLIEKELITQQEADSLTRVSEKGDDKLLTAVDRFKTAFKSEAFNLSGYGQVIYTASEHTGDITPAPNATHSSIEVARVILFATGKLGVRNQIGYMLMYDLGPGAKMHEMYGEWTPTHAFNVRFGQYKIPFTIENPMSPTRIETIYFSRSGTAMSGSAGDFNQYNPDGSFSGVKAGRDAGIQVSGAVFPHNGCNRLEYYAGLFNGSGLNTKDKDNHKDFIGTLYCRPLKELKVGGSVYSGKLYGTVLGGPLGSHVRNRWTVGAEYSGKSFYARSEYIEANDGGLRRCGGYASAAWKIMPDKWEVLCKYDYYNDNKRADRNEISDLTAGVNFYFAYLSRLQLNYIYTDNKALGSNNLIAAQLQVFF